MNKVDYCYRGNITDVMVNGSYVGCVIKTDAGYVTQHKNCAESKTFQSLHFATYHVEKATPQ